MRVDVHGRIKVSVAQPFLYLFRMPALGGQQGGCGMPERMECHIWPAKFSYELFKMMAHIVRRNRMAVLPDEQFRIV